jgi:hypothetical protein
MYDVIEKKIEDAPPERPQSGRQKLIIRSIAGQTGDRFVGIRQKTTGIKMKKSNKVADELFQLLQSLFHSSKAEELVLIKPSVNRSFLSHFHYRHR